VPGLFAVESHPTVHHLVSTVVGELDRGKTAVDLLAACFPGGSVTGAPKVRAMEVIEEMEPVRRGVYCGAVGYIGFNGNMAMNIPIRTMVVKDGRLTFSAGGAIVHDSVPEGEYQETLDKVRGLMRSLGVGWT
jgi:para-aminobenzoate synthetase component 1